MTLNSFHVDLLTRRWLRRSHAELGPMLDDIEAVLVRHRRTNLCGLVYDAAGMLGVRDDHRAALATFAELFYCCIGALDDIQDGDADDYMPWPLWRQVNVAMTLLSLSEARVLETWRDNLHVFGAISCDTSRAHYEMVVAQHAELQARATGYAPPWDVDAYEQHARWTAGSELALFLGAVGAAAMPDFLDVFQCNLRPVLREVGYAVGVLLQIRVDSATRDERITVLPVAAVDDLRRRQAELFTTHAQALPSELVALLGRET